MQAKRFLVFVILVFLTTLGLGYFIYDFDGIVTKTKGDAIAHVAIIPGYATILVASVAIYFYLKMEDPDTLQSRSLRDSLRTVREEIHNINFYIKEGKTVLDVSTELNDIIVKSFDEYLESEKFLDVFIDHYKKNHSQYIENNMYKKLEKDYINRILIESTDNDDKLSQLENPKFAKLCFYYLQKYVARCNLNSFVSSYLEEESLQGTSIVLYEDKQIPKFIPPEGLLDCIAEGFCEYMSSKKSLSAFDEAKWNVLNNMLKRHNNIDFLKPLDTLAMDSPIKIAFLSDSYKRISDVLRQDSLFGLLDYLQKQKSKDSEASLNYVELSYEIFELSYNKDRYKGKESELLDQFILVQEKLSELDSLIINVNIRDIERYLNA